MNQVYIHTKVDESVNKKIAIMAARTGQDKCSIINQALKEGLMAKKKTSKKKPGKKSY